MSDAQWQVLAKHFAEMSVVIIGSHSLKTVSKGGSADMTQAKESKGAKVENFFSTFFFTHIDKILVQANIIC